MDVPFNASAREWSLSARCQPATTKARAPQTCYDVGTAPHKAPEQSCTIVLEHQNDRPLIEREVVFGDPGRTSGVATRKRRIETTDEPVFVFHVRVRLGTVREGGKHDLRSEWQRCGDGPRRQRAIIRTIRHAA